MGFAKEIIAFLGITSIANAVRIPPLSLRAEPRNPGQFRTAPRLLRRFAPRNDE